MLTVHDTGVGCNCCMTLDGVLHLPCVCLTFSLLTGVTHLHRCVMCATAYSHLPSKSSRCVQFACLFHSNLLMALALATRRTLAQVAVCLHAGYSTGITFTARARTEGHSQQAGAHRASTGSAVHLHGMCSTPEESSGLYPVWAYLLLWLPYEGQSEWGACVSRVQQPACQWLC